MRLSASAALCIFKLSRVILAYLPSILLYEYLQRLTDVEGIAEGRDLLYFKRQSVFR